MMQICRICGKWYTGVAYAGLPARERMEVKSGCSRLTASSTAQLQTNRICQKCHTWNRHSYGWTRARFSKRYHRGRGPVGCAGELHEDDLDVAVDPAEVAEVLEVLKNSGSEKKELEYGIEEIEKYSTGVYFDDDDEIGEVGPDHKAGYVGLIGLPNAGKSTLLNSLIGQKLAIVTQKAQTTRQRVRGLLSEENFQMIFFDTPGIITRFQTKLDEKMMESVKQAVDESDVVLMLVDTTDDPKADLQMIQPPVDWAGPPMAVVLNKMDLISQSQRKELYNWYKKNCRVDDVFLTNAKLGHGIDDVKDWALQHMPKGPPLYPKQFVTEQPERFFVAEIIREKIFLQYQEEIPYSIQVNVVDFKERPKKKDYILVNIVTERPMQRAIILGKGGSAIKLLAIASRLDIEEFLGRPVYLEMNVSVVKDWRKSSKHLTTFGY